MAYQKQLRQLKVRLNMSDELLAHELQLAGIEVSVDGLKSWVYGRRTPASRHHAALDTFFAEKNMQIAIVTSKRLKLGCKVTSKVLAYAGNREEQKQIAVSAPLNGAAKQDQYALIKFTDNTASSLLIVGDTNAIWRSHIPVENREFFDRLFGLLAVSPDEYLWFDCIVETEV